MTTISPVLSTPELMRVAADFRNGACQLSNVDRELLVALLKERASKELDYGQELSVDQVKLVRRVTGAVSVFFGM
ncbi:MAG: hypothetical protein K2Z81_05435 [Cyanobacteria bacterium]|nr:hypothetical protein [Cyanobacteriota bacterium]